jgi:hypothetical protein
MEFLLLVVDHQRPALTERRSTVSADVAIKKETSGAEDNMNPESGSRSDAAIPLCGQL